MSKAAAAWHWKHTVQKVIDDAGPLTDKGTVLTAIEAGTYELIYSDGTQKSVQVPSIPKPVDLSTAWNLECPKGWGPNQVKLDQLISWTEHSDDDMKYFSGTEVYTKQFDVPNDRLSDDCGVSLDLGDVVSNAKVAGEYELARADQSVQRINVDALPAPLTLSRKGWSLEFMPGRDMSESNKLGKFQY